MCEKNVSALFKGPVMEARNLMPWGRHDGMRVLRSVIRWLKSRDVRFGSNM